MLRTSVVQPDGRSHQLTEQGQFPCAFAIARAHRLCAAAQARGACGKGLDLGNLAQNVELHQRIASKTRACSPDGAKPHPGDPAFRSGRRSLATRIS